MYGPQRAIFQFEIIPLEQCNMFVKTMKSFFNLKSSYMLALFASFEYLCYMGLLYITFTLLYIFNYLSAGIYFRRHNMTSKMYPALKEWMWGVPDAWMQFVKEVVHFVRTPLVLRKQIFHSCSAGIDFRRHSRIWRLYRRRILTSKVCSRTGTVNHWYNCVIFLP